MEPSLLKKTTLHPLRQPPSSFSSLRLAWLPSAGSLGKLSSETWNKIQIRDTGLCRQSCLGKEWSVRSTALSPGSPDQALRKLTGCGAGCEVWQAFVYLLPGFQRPAGPEVPVGPRNPRPRSAGRRRCRLVFPWAHQCQPHRALSVRSHPLLGAGVGLSPPC